MRWAPTPPSTLHVGPVGVALIVATMTALGACTADRPPATPSSVLTSSFAPATTPSATSSADPTSPFAVGSTTLRTIAAAKEPDPQLTVGRQIAANETYISHAAMYTSDGLTISAVLHAPVASGPHPGVVVVHGFVDPASYVTGGELPREQDALARAGYVVLFTDLRGLAGSDPAPSGAPDLDMGSTEDVVNGVRALAGSHLPGLDPERIGLLGHSLGGLLVLRVLVAMPGLVDAVVAFAPSSTDPFENVERYLAPGDPVYQAVIAAHGTPATNPRYWADISPRTFVGDVTDPLLIVHGDADGDSPYSWSVATVAAWKQAGKDVRLVTLKGEDHVFQARWGDAIDAVKSFLAENLR